MRRAAALFLSLLFLLAACAAPAGEDAPDPPEAPAEAETPAEPSPAENVLPAGAVESEDHILLTLEAPLADGRTLTLEAVGRVLDEYTCGVREVRVYDGDALLQAVPACDAVEAEWGSAADAAGEYTSCWSPEKTMEALDLNFDGNTDFGLFGWMPNNTIPYYYWTWDAEAGAYKYACTLQGAEVRPETGEVVSEYKSGEAGSQYIHDYYRPDETGALYLVRHEVSIFSSDAPNHDAGRSIQETWLPREDAVIRPVIWYDGDLILVCRKVPVFEINSDNTRSHFTEIWELKDGELQMIGREEFFYENQQ